MRDVGILLYKWMFVYTYYVIADIYKWYEVDHGRQTCFHRQRSLHREDIWALIYDFDFLLWALHVFHTSVFFLTCCAMAYIYGLRLSPALDASGLTHPSDKFWRSSGSWLLGLKSMPAVDLLLSRKWSV